MDQKKSWSFIGLFIIALVVSLPFYAADVYAVSVSVTGNHGEAGIEGFIDANGDTWTVEATIAGADEEVVPENVKVKIGGNEAEFDSCSEGVSGTVCEYVSLLDNGVNEDRYSFNVLYYLGAGGTASSSLEAVKADGSAPSITFNSIRQDGGEIKLDFSVSDEPSAYCVGLDKIEIIDAGDGAVLQTISSFEEKDCDFDFSESGGVLEVSLSGEGRKSLKIKAEDRLGHESSEFKSFSMDFAAPVIGDEIIFVDIGEFVGKHEVETDIKVNVTESGGSLKAKAYSEQAELDGDIVSCVEEDNWVCTWKDVSVSSSESISVRIVAEDGAGNTAEKTLRKSFAVDDSAPVAVFFGTERTFNGESYVKKGKNQIVLKIDESGAGISKEGIRANLAGLGEGKFEEPDDCEEVEGLYECYWNTVKESFSSGTVSISLSKFEDKVGNEGKRLDTEVTVDTKKPAVKEIEVYGLGLAGKKDFFQSGDSLVVELLVEEANGLLVLVDMNDLVMSADEKFSSFAFGDLGEYIGWAKFTEEDCSREEGKWVCSLEVSEGIRSGYDSSAALAVKVYDTAGNGALWDDKPSNAECTEGDCELELLGLDEETEPDFWEVKSVSYAPSFIDLDTVGLINTRMSAKVELRADDAVARKIELVGGSCVSEGEVELERALLYGGEGFQEDKASATIVLEFETFDADTVFGAEIEAAKEEGKFETAAVAYTCKLQIYSQVGKKAIAAAEEQEVKLEVVFGFSELGAQDENLEWKIKEAKDSTYFQIFDKIKYLKTVVQIAEMVCLGYQAIRDIISLWNILDGKIGLAEEKATAVPPARAALFAARSSSCKAKHAVDQGANEGLEGFFNAACNLVSCKTTQNSGWTSWHTDWNKWGMDKLKAINADLPVDFSGAKDPAYYLDPKSSLIMSAMTGCIPGIIYNLDKFRQVQCVYINCLQTDVKAGLATVSTCEEMRGLFICKYVMGEIWSFLPVANWLKYWAGYIRTIIMDPFSWGLAGFLGLACAPSCEAPNEWPNFACALVAFGAKALDVYTDIREIYNTVKWGLPYDYCKQMEEGGKSPAAGEIEAGGAEEE